MIGNEQDNAEKKVSAFYTTVGWKTVDGITEDAKRFEDLREHAKLYIHKCRLRVLMHIPENGTNILDMASGPIQYIEYLEYSKNFKKRYCVDLSQEALDQAKCKIGDHGIFLHGSFFDIQFDENFFDCAISLHTIYHIDRDRQEEAVRKLLYVTKTNQPVIIVYSNPNALISIVKYPFHLLKKVAKTFLIKFMKYKSDDNSSGLYFHAHPMEWWNRFSDVSTVEIMPWRSFESSDQKRLIPNNRIGSKIFDMLFDFEEKFPNFFVKYFQYPMIILTKK